MPVGTQLVSEGDRWKPKPPCTRISSHPPALSLGKDMWRMWTGWSQSSLGIDPACSEPQPQPPPLSFMGWLNYSMVTPSKMAAKLRIQLLILYLWQPKDILGIAGSLCQQGLKDEQSSLLAIERCKEYALQLATEQSWDNIVLTLGTLG
jgi:hypothetical protein